MLHVFWEAPSAAAATELLEGLRKCARATHWDTPCTLTMCRFVLLARGNPKGEADPTRLLMFLKTPFRTCGGPRDGRVPSGLGAPHAPSALNIMHAYQ